jgi:hypothetical protein
MNSTFLDLKWKDALLSALIAVIVVVANVVLPALKEAGDGQTFFVNWAALGYMALYTFGSSLLGLFLTNSNGQPLTKEPTN